MGEVTQTIGIGDIDGVYGNCLQAAIASYFDLPIEAVPHFVQFEECWFAALTLWLKATDHGVVERVSSAQIPSDLVVILLGTSPRVGIHCVIGRGCVVTWDPHPSRAGLNNVTGALVISEHP